MFIAHRRLFCVALAAILGWSLWTQFYFPPNVFPKENFTDNANGIFYHIDTKSWFHGTSAVKKEMSNVEQVLLWWTLIYNEVITFESQCDQAQQGSSIIVTTDRKFLAHPNLTAILFYGSNIDITDLPVPRSNFSPWALLHEESPKNMAFLAHSKGIALFNWTSTFSRYSTFPLSPMTIRSTKDLLDNTYMVALDRKNKMQADEQKLAPVAYVQSICNTMSGRDDYVQDLMRFIDVDSYGQCLHNRDMPDHLADDDYLRSIDSPEFFAFLARYKFVIAIENSVCDDYVTEKLWRPLTLGVIPIYFGAPNIRDWLPHPSAAILIADYEGPRQLAEFLHFLNENDVAYEEFTRPNIARPNSRISNEFLLHAIEAKRQRTTVSKSLFTQFECSVAAEALRSDHTAGNADHTHYPCAESDHRFAVVDGEFGKTHKNLKIWQNVWQKAVCEADVLDELIRSNVSFSSVQFEANMKLRFDSAQCKI